MRDCSLQASTAFGERAPQPPEAPERTDQTKLRVGVAGGGGTIDCDTEVVVLLVQLSQPAFLLRPREICAFGQFREVVHMRSLQLWPAIAEQLEAVLPDRFEHAKTRLPSNGIALQETVVDQRAQPVQIRTGDGRRSGERASPGEDREPCQVSTLIGREKCSAPLERVSQRLLPGREVMRA